MVDIKELFDKYATTYWTGNIGNLPKAVDEESFSKAIKEARKEGIRFIQNLMDNYGTAKTFNERIKKELDA